MYYMEMIFPVPFQVHARKKKQQTKHVLGPSCQTQTPQYARKGKQHEENV